METFSSLLFDPLKIHFFRFFFSTKMHFYSSFDVLPFTVNYHLEHLVSIGMYQNEYIHALTGHQGIVP